MTFKLETRIKCSECPIRHRAVCARCDDDELALLESMKTYRTFQPGATIHWTGDEMVYVSSVIQGVATLSRTMEDGRKQVVGLLLPSDFIGRPGRGHIDFDVTATTEVVLCSFERKPFERLIESTPHVAQRMLEMALDELDAARDWMLLLGRKTAREKIATFIGMLLRRSRPDGVDAGANVPDLELPLTRDEIANFLGLTLETVSRQLSMLKAEKVLYFLDRRRFEVLDAEALRLASGDDD